MGKRRVFSFFSFFLSFCLPSMSFNFIHFIDFLYFLDSTRIYQSFSLIILDYFLSFFSIIFVLFSNLVHLFISPPPFPPLFLLLISFVSFCQFDDILSLMAIFVLFANYIKILANGPKSLGQCRCALLTLSPLFFADNHYFDKYICVFIIKNYYYRK